MKQDFIFLNVPGLMARKEVPPIGRWQNVVRAFVAAEISFLVDSGLLERTEAIVGKTIEDVVLKLSDLTPEGQNFLMSGATDSWLGACDRKSNAMLAKGASDEERLRIYADPSGLYKRLEKFRKHSGNTTQNRTITPSG